ncbi:Uncharacterised protein [Mycobacterium tuberculosis]|nr:Uncharacterised protein [Mycobacterium tuberculosis]
MPVLWRRDGLPTAVGRRRAGRAGPRLSQPSVGADVEAEPPAVGDVEVRHDLREAPDGAPGLKREHLIYRQMMDERGGSGEGSGPAALGAGRVHHDRGAVLVVSPQIPVDVAHQHLHHDCLTGQVFAHPQPAVVDEALRWVGGHREHRGMQVGGANAHRHGEHRAGDGVLRDGHIAHCSAEDRDD